MHQEIYLQVPGALDMAEDKLSQLGKKALIVTDNVMVELGNCAKVEAALKTEM